MKSEYGTLEGARLPRVMHVLGSLNPGGVEMWLLEAIRNYNDELVTSICTLKEGPGALDDQFRSLGVRIVRCPLNVNLIAFGRRFLTLLRDEPQDVVHSHVHQFSGVVLALARRAGVPVRISHSHTAADDKKGLRFRPLYRAIMKRLLRRNATHRLAASTLAGQALYGEAGFDVLHYGVRLQASAPKDRDALRAGFGIARGASVVGHVGRLVAAKNQFFLLEIWQAYRSLDPAARLVIVGDGPLDHALRAYAAKLDLGSSVLFLGARLDVPQLMHSLFDALILPSLWEGLPVVTLEAQAAGLPALVSDNVSREIAVVGTLVQFIPLSAGAQQWARALDGQLRKAVRVPADEAMGALRGSAFDSAVSGGLLLKHYRRALQDAQVFHEPS
jgi:glycosyltransferase involved in cell wall biosynthesis